MFRFSIPLRGYAPATLSIALTRSDRKVYAAIPWD